jgi:hypothetical protein
MSRRAGSDRRNVSHALRASKWRTATALRRSEVVTARRPREVTPSRTRSRLQSKRKFVAEEQTDVFAVFCAWRSARMRRSSLLRRAEVGRRRCGNALSSISDDVFFLIFELFGRMFADKNFLFALVLPSAFFFVAIVCSKIGGAD